MKYKVRDGIVLSEICGEYLLISSQSARRYCPSVLQINETGAFIWKMLKEGADRAQLIRLINDVYEVEHPEDIDSILDQYLDLLKNSGYLIGE